MILIVSWSGDAALLFYILSFICLAVGIYRVVNFYHKISGKSKDPARK